MPTGQVNLIWYTISKRSLRLKPCLHVRCALCLCMYAHICRSIPPQQTSRDTWAGFCFRSFFIGALIWALRREAHLLGRLITLNNNAGGQVYPLGNALPPQVAIPIQTSIEFSGETCSNLEKYTSALKVLEWKDYVSRFFSFFLFTFPHSSNQSSMRNVVWIPRNAYNSSTGENNNRCTFLSNQRMSFEFNCKNAN